MNREELAAQIVKFLDELEERFAESTITLKEMAVILERQGIAHLDGYLRRAGALDYQSPKRFFQAGPCLDSVRDELKKNEVPRGLEGLFSTSE